ncbi:MAG: FAD-dependent oxidoreductase [Thermoplasmata archaeon]
MEKQDVVIVGAGIFGVAIGYHILKENPGKKVTIFEKFPTCGQGNTAKSAGAFRNVFSSKTNFLLADSSVDFYLDIHKRGYDIGLEEAGYLWLMSHSQLERNKDVLANMQRNGVELRFYEKEELKRSMPYLNTDIDPDDDEARIMGLEPIEKGVFGVKCGFVDADKLTRFYEGEFKKMGGQVVYNTEVAMPLLEPKEKLGLECEPLIWQDVEITGVKLKSGKTVNADKVVIAANSWAPLILDPVGIDCMIKSVKRQMFVLRSPKLSPLMKVEGFNKYNTLPFTIFPKSAIYIRVDRIEGSVWASGHEHFGAPYLFEEDPKATDEYYDYNIYQVLRKYMPMFDGLKAANKWAGLYDMNTIDANPYIFETHNVIIAVGSSGSGIMKADAVGRITAALYAGRKNAELFGNREFNVEALGLRHRNVESEKFIL